jgi:uroporphyrinogen decarboxylase
MDSEKIILDVLARQKVDRPPYWFMRQAGRFLPEYREIRSTVSGILELCYTPVLAEKVTLQPVNRFDTDAAILFSDILVIPDALGQKVEFVEGEGPSLEPINNQTDLRRLSLKNLSEHLSPVIETVSRLHSSLPKDKALIGFAGSPWTVATYMVEGRSSRDYAKTKTWAFSDPEGFAELIGLLEHATIDYLLRQIDAGADVIQLFDTWAGVLPASQMEKWCIDPTRRIVTAVKDKYPNVPIIGFPRGIGAGIVQFADRTGVSAVGLDSSVDPRWASHSLQQKYCVQGNLDPGMLYTGGSAMIRESEHIISSLGSGPFIFNLGHGVWPTTNPKNMELLVNRLRSFRYA